MLVFLNCQAHNLRLWLLRAQHGVCGMDIHVHEDPRRFCHARAYPFSRIGRRGFV